MQIAVSYFRASIKRKILQLVTAVTLVKASWKLTEKMTSWQLFFIKIIHNLSLEF